MMDGQYGNVPYEMPQGAPRQAVFDPAPHKRFFSSVGLRYFLGALIIYAVQILVGVVANFLLRGKLENINVSIAVSMLPMYLVGMPLLALLVTRLPGKAPERAPFTFGRFLKFFCIAYAVMIVTNFIATIVGLIIELFVPGAQASTNEVQSILLGGDAWLLVLFAVVCAPVFEELLFRKLLIDRVGRYGEGIAVILSGLFFGLFHGNLTQFAYAFALGCIFAYVYVKTGNIFLTIAMHVIINFLGSVVGLKVLEMVDYTAYLEVAGSGDIQAMMSYVMEHSSGFAVLGIYYIFVIGVVITGIVFLIIGLAKKQFVFRRGEITIPGGKRFSTVILNVGMILYIVFFLLVIVYSMLSPLLETYLEGLL